MTGETDDLEDLGALDVEIDPTPLRYGADLPPPPAKRGAKPGSKPVRNPESKMSAKARAILERVRAARSKRIA